MICSIKKYIKDLMVSLVIIFFIIFSGTCLASKIINNSKFFNYYISQKINLNNNVFNKEFLYLIKKYLEAVIDSIIEFEKVPSINDVKNFFILVVNILDNNLKIDSFKILNNQLILICQFETEVQIDNFVKKIKEIDYIDDIFYNDYIKNNNQYLVEIFCVHNE